MPRPKTQSDDTVLSATGRVLLSKGPHAFTLADVARETGLSPATLIQRFGTKRGLLLAFSRRAAEQASVPFDARADLRGALTQLARGIRTRTELANSLALLLEDVRDDELRAYAVRHARTLEAAISEKLRGRLPPRRVRPMARTILAAYNGALVQWALSGSGRIETFVGRTLDPLLALLPKPRRL